MGEEVRVWYDEEGDYLEVLFEREKGYFRETSNDAVMEKVDEEGRIIGFSILKVSVLKGQPPLAVTLKTDAPESSAPLTSGR
jgi:uncharacterized protein YuzE